MHDPSVVAHELVLPIPRRKRYRDAKPGERRWSLRRMRCTNTENLGEPVYSWWRLKGYDPVLAGRAFGLYRFGTIWHNEPGGRDAFDVCEHRSRWKWHVWHWSIQIAPLQGIRARLFDRCEVCGRKGRPNIGHGWEGHRLGWWKFTTRKGLYHRECSDLVHTRRSSEQKDDLIRLLAAQLRIETDESESELIERLMSRGQPGGTPGFTENFHMVRQLEHILGFERGDNFKLVKSGA